MLNIIKNTFSSYSEWFLNNILSPITDSPDWSLFIGQATLILALSITNKFAAVTKANQTLVAKTFRTLAGKVPEYTILLGIGWFLLSIFFSYKVSGNWDNSTAWWHNFNNHVVGQRWVITISITSGIVGGFWIRFYIGRKIEPKLETYFNKFIRLNKDELIDVRNIERYTPEHIKYNPQEYYALAKKKQTIFLGIDEFHKPVLLPLDQYLTENIQVLGPPGRGKGVCAGTVLHQGITNFDHGVCVFDPKNDAWASSVMYDACKKSGRPFLLIDLRSGKPPQINPFNGMSSDELNEMLVAGFSLGKKGEAADHYRLNDREICWQLSKSIQKGDHIGSLLERLFELAGKEGEGFVKQFKELARLSPLHAEKGASIEQFINKGGCLYIIGSMRDEAVIQLQKMLFIRIVQLIENKSSERHISIFLDEIKYLISSPTVNALGTIRDKGCNLIITHQSLGDLKQVGQDLNPQATFDNVVDNCPIKWIYKPSTYEVAEWSSLQSGKVIVNQQSQKTQVNIEGIRLEDAEVSTKQTYQQKYDTNVILNLPKFCALCIGVGAARLAFSQPVPVEKLKFKLHQEKAVHMSETLSDYLGKDEGGLL